MSYNNIRPAAIGITAGALTAVALVALIEYDPIDTAIDRLAQLKLTPAERAELARIDQKAGDRSREAHAFKERRDAERAETDALDLAGFAPDLLSTPGLAATAAELTIAELAAEIVRAEQVRRAHRFRAPGLAEAHRRHHSALNCEWRRRDALDARFKLSRPEALRHRIATEKVQAARLAPWPPLPTVAPFVEN